MEEIEFSRWLFEGRLRQGKSVLPDGLNWLCYLAGSSKSHCCQILQTLFWVFQYSRNSQCLYTNFILRLIDTAEPNSMLKKLSFLMDSEQDAFQLVLLSRLTPIPFGLQNSLFAVSTMSFDKYLQATCLGLFPCQIINVYLGSTLRSMEEVS